ncbi:MAG: S41 family peptidase [Longimicrobiales bacterium]|nr:S41 family peptidase [Longimicrobiales bacterium]
MIKRNVAVATLIFALLTPAAQAQSTDGAAQQPPEVDVLASAVNAISRMHMQAFSDSTLWEAAIDGLIKALDDPYAELFTPAEAEAWEEDTTGNYSGIGLQITQLNDEITVTAVFRGFPADEHGLIVGDVIVGVNEHDASDWTTGMAADSIRGPVGTPVEVRIKRKGYAQPLSFDINRAEVHVPAVYSGVLEGDIGYVIMDRVARNAAREMNEALATMADKRGLIIDLRRNPGGFLDESLMLADLFLKPGSTLASTVQRVPGGDASEPETDSYNDRWPQLVPDLPVVILVDEFTASGAEILAGALQDYDRAVVLGQRTFGKGVVQTVMNLPYGRRLRFTTGSWLTPLGRSLQRERDAQGRPLPENPDSLPRVETASGRSLIAGGGVFPDLLIRDDTLKTSEQEFIRASNEAQFPLGLRITEFGFSVAADRRASGAEPSLTEAEFQEFVESLVSEGMDEELLQNPDVRDYLFWRVEMAVAQRMDDIGAEAAFRMKRDPVLTEAVRLLNQASSQTDLFRIVDAMPEAPQRPGAG